MASFPFAQNSIGAENILDVVSLLGDEGYVVANDVACLVLRYGQTPSFDIYGKGLTQLPQTGCAADRKTVEKALEYCPDLVLVHSGRGAGEEDFMERYYLNPLFVHCLRNQNDKTFVALELGDRNVEVNIPASIDKVNQALETGSPLWHGVAAATNVNLKMEAGL